MADGELLAGDGNVELFCEEAAFQFFFLLFFGFFCESGFNFRFDLVDKTADDRSFFGRNFAHTAKNGGQFALFAEIFDTDFFCVIRRFNFGKCFDSDLFKQCFHDVFPFSLIFNREKDFTAK